MIYQVRVSKLGTRAAAAALCRILLHCTEECIKLARQARRGTVPDPNGLAGHLALWTTLRKHLMSAQPLAGGELRISNLTKAQAVECCELYDCYVGTLSAKERREARTGVVAVRRQGPGTRTDRGLVAA